VQVLAARRTSSSPPAGLAAYYKAETDKWWPIIKAANLKMQ
jgi:hypothetical protein